MLCVLLIINLLSYHIGHFNLFILVTSINTTLLSMKFYSSKRSSGLITQYIQLDDQGKVNYKILRLAFHEIQIPGVTHMYIYYSISYKTDLFKAKGIKLLEL